MQSVDTNSNSSPLARAGRLAWWLLAFSLLFGWVLWPFSGAIWWAVFVAIVFVPWERAVRRRLGNRPSLSAALSLVAIVLTVMLPLAVLAASLAEQAAAMAARWKAGNFDLTKYYRQIFDALPAWTQNLLSQLGVDNMDAAQQWMLSVIADRGELLTGRVFLLGQNTLDWLLSFGLMLYLLFFLLRDGDKLSQQVVETAPLPLRHTRVIAERFVSAVRATVKGNVIMALVQGSLGMLAFWTLDLPGALLWGAVMAVLSLIPAVGAALVWGPVAVYMLATGAFWHGVALIAWGALVIGMVDNVLRPILVGRDTQLPDYVVLFSTLGGIASFGIQGFVLGPVVAVLFLCAWELWDQDHPKFGAGHGTEPTGKRTTAKPGQTERPAQPRSGRQAGQRSDLSNPKHRADRYQTPQGVPVARDSSPDAGEKKK